MSTQLLKLHYLILLSASIVIVLLSCSTSKKYTVDEHMVIRQQGSFAVGGTVITNPGVLTLTNPPRPGKHSMVNTDKIWAEPARFTANAFAKNGSPAYIYFFSYVPDSLKRMMPFGAAHASEIPYVFNTLGTRRGITAETALDKDVAATMNTYWANFARTGNPNGKGIPTYPKNETI